MKQIDATHRHSSDNEVVSKIKGVSPEVKEESVHLSPSKKSNGSSSKHKKKPFFALYKD